MISFSSTLYFSPNGVCWMQIIWIRMWTWVIIFHCLDPVVFQVIFLSQSDKHLMSDIYILRNQHQCSSVIIGVYYRQKKSLHQSSLESRLLHSGLFLFIVCLLVPAAGSYQSTNTCFWPSCFSGPVDSVSSSWPCIIDAAPWIQTN